MDRELILPSDFDDYAWAAEAKGYLWEAVVNVDGARIEVNFYDPARLAQDVADDLAHNGAFAAKRLLVVARVTVDNMRAAIDAAPPEFFT